MKMSVLRLLGGILYIVAFVSPAMATTNLFVPVSGAAFQFEGGQGAYNTVVLEGGVMYNTSANYVTLEASLGHAQGGSNQFTINTFQNNGTTTCWIAGTYDFSGSSGVMTTWSSGVSATGLLGWEAPFLTINTNFPAVGQTYTASCQLPPYNGGPAAIVGVIPNH